MRDTDQLVSYQLASHVAEVGSAFHITVTRAPADGTDNSQQIGKVRSLRVHLRYYTEGRGNTDMHEYPSVDVPIDRFGMGREDVQLDIPFNALISYDGSLIRIRYQLVIRTDRQHAFDDETKIDVIVVPKGGASTYELAHPLRSGRA